MRASIIFIGQGFTTNEKKRIGSFIVKTANRSAKLLNIKNQMIYFTVYRFGKGRYNLGFTKAKDWIEITIPAGKVDYEDLKAMVHHEMHHIARGYCGLLEKGEHVMLDTLFSEGLATAFEVEQVPSRLPESAKYTSLLIKKWLPRIAKKFSSTKYNYYEWFHGEGKPNQLGYKIGKYLVDEIIKRHPSQTPLTLLRIDAKKLLRMSRNSKI